jgi:SAM-dependent methyltransferase
MATTQTKPVAALIGELHGRFVYGRRVQVLSRHFAEMIPTDASVLDVGCGDGLIAKLILERRPDLAISGIDVALRPKPHIPVKTFDGSTIPYPDKSFDIVSFVDVLHHTEDPRVLLKEACRVARKTILIKDHNRDGLASGPILRLMDWMGNAPHGVVLTYNYWPKRRWHEAFSDFELPVGEYRARLGLYPAPARWVFERSLHFIVALEVPH